jgi:hypothetical protein
MRVSYIYATAYVSVLGSVIVWRLLRFLTARARDHVFSILSKWLIHTVVLARLNGSSDVSVIAGLMVFCMIVGNVISSVIAVTSQADFSARLARLCITNLVILFLGGRTNFIADKLLQLSHNEYHLAHRWIGRICIVEGLIHGILSAFQHRKPLRAIDITVGFIVTRPFTSDAYCLSCFHLLGPLGCAPSFTSVAGFTSYSSICILQPPLLYLSSCGYIKLRWYHI